MLIIVPSRNIYNAENKKIVKNKVHSTLAEVYNIKKIRKSQISFNTQLFSEGVALYNLGLGEYINLTPIRVFSENIDDNWNYAEDWGCGTQYQRHFVFYFDGENYLDFETSIINLSFKYKKGKRFEEKTVDDIFTFEKGSTGSVKQTDKTGKISQETSIFSLDLEGGYNVSVKCNIVPNDDKTGFSANLYVPWYGWGDDNKAIAFLDLNVEISNEIYDKSKETVTIGDGKNSFSLTTNEFMQLNSTYNEETIFGRISNKIIQKYRNGKETATILCSISDYFSDTGEKAIDIKGGKMSFDIGDQVIPMVFGSDGVDKPMSKRQDGSAKAFQVVGIRFIYDGAVWQELTLQEA
jgi:hypothetical protein